MPSLNPLSHTFGLDIGDRSFKVVQVVRTRNPKMPYKLTAWGEIEVPEGVMQRGEIADLDKAVGYLKELVKSTNGRLKGRGVVACLPEAKTFIKIIETPEDISEDALRKEVIREIEQNIPLPPDEIYFDWQTLDPRAGRESASLHQHDEKRKRAEDAKETESDGKEEDAKTDEKEAKKETESPAMDGATSGRIRVLIGAAPKQLVDTYTTLLERADLAPVALEIEATAISRAIMPIDEPPKEPVGILDIGATRSSLVIYDNGIIQMSISIPISGIEITQAISDALGVNMTDAETLKKECGLDANRCEDKMWKILLPLIDDMTDKIRNALRFYKVGFPQGKKIERLYLCGGGAHFKEIDTVLSRKLTIKVERGQALTNIHDAVPRDYPKARALSHVTAIGLAIRAADEQHRHKKRLR